MALKVEDRREKPDPVIISLRMLRPPELRTRSHVAASKLEARDRRIILTQKFSEDGYYCGTAVVVGVIGREVWTRRANDEELRLVVPAGKGAFTVLIGSAAGFDRNADLVAEAQGQIDAASSKGFDKLLEANRAWWSGFWARSLVRLHSADGVADVIERNYTYYLYLMASSSRGKYPHEIQRHALDHGRRHAPLGRPVLGGQSKLSVQQRAVWPPIRSSF